MRRLLPPLFLLGTVLLELAVVIFLVLPVALFDAWRPRESC